MKKFIVLISILLTGCISDREVLDSYHRGCVTPYGTNKKMMKFEKNYKKRILKN